MPQSRQSTGRGRFGCFRHRAVLCSADQAARNLTFVAGAGWRQLTLHCKPVVMLPIVPVGPRLIVPLPLSSKSVPRRG